MASEPRVPKLRFPEFRHAHAWSEVRLGSVLHEHGSKSDGSSEVHSVSVHKGIINQVEHLGRSFAAADTARYNLVKPHDLVYTKSPTGDFPYGVVKQSKLDHPALVSPLYGVFTPANKYIGYLLDAYFESAIRTNKYLASITQKGAKNTVQISNDTFLSKGLYLPSNPQEQRKIADCLKSLDELITAEERNVSVLRTFKRALIQNLFPQEGETNPRLRFPKFRDAQEWALVPLGEVIAESTARNSGNSSSRPVMGVTKADGVVPMQERLIGADRSRYKLLRHDWFAYNPMRLNIGSISRYTGERDVVVSPDYVVFRCKEPDLPMIRPDYLDHYRFSNRWHSFVNRGHNLGIRVRIYYDDLAEFLIPLPEPDEQRHVAACLDSLDTLITQQTNQFETLKTYKQGLMQGLFPPTESGE